MNKLLRNNTAREILRLLLAVGTALLLGFIITLFVSEDPIKAYTAFLTGPLTRFNRMGDWIEESITLIFVGLAIAVAFKSKQFSLAGEGQLLLGALVSGVVALYVPLPAVLRVPLALLAAAAVGFAWGVIPGYLKAHLNANEIVSTLMLNTVALKLYDYFLIFKLKPPDAGYNTSAPFPPEGVLTSWVPNLPFLAAIREKFDSSTNISIMVWVLLAATLFAYYLIYHTPFGYQLRMVGSNIKFANYGGINTKRTIILAFAISGIFAGLAGAHLSMGIHGRLIASISMGLGFEGIVVATMARNNPLFVPLAGLFYGYLRAGADVMERTSDMSREMVMMVQAVIILLVTAERLLPVIQQQIEERNGLSKEARPAVEGGSNVH